MTFSTDVPNAGQSPGEFPTQNNTNFTRLQALLAAEHQFNNTAQVTDGVHLQMTMIAREDPASLPAGTNGMLYCKVVSGVPQVLYFDGTNPNIIFPFQGPIVQTGTFSLSGGASSPTIITPPINTQGTLFVNYPGTTAFTYYLWYQSGSLTPVQGVLLSSGPVSPPVPTASFGVGSIQVVNNRGSTYTTNYYMQYTVLTV